MKKFVAGIQYDGSAYSGWQKQHHAPSVQKVTEEAFAKVANEPINLFCAGRTDTGVHAKEQIVHFESSATRSDYAWRMGGNTYLPDDVRILWCQPVADDFHARFSALSRQYRYIIYTHQSESALLKHKVYWLPFPLNTEKMNTAAQVLLGEHDFSSFRAAACQSHTAFRNIHSIKVSRLRDFVFIDIEANAFLHHMVRNIVGSLIDIGREKKPVEWMQALLLEKNRNQAGATAAAFGLYFMQANYPAHFALAQQRNDFDVLF